MYARRTARRDVLRMAAQRLMQAAFRPFTTTLARMGRGLAVKIKLIALVILLLLLLLH